MRLVLRLVVFCESRDAESLVPVLPIDEQPESFSRRKAIFSNVDFAEPTTEFLKPCSKLAESFHDKFVFVVFCINRKQVAGVTSRRELPTWLRAGVNRVFPGKLRIRPPCSCQKHSQEILLIIDRVDPLPDPAAAKFDSAVAEFPRIGQQPVTVKLVAVLFVSARFDILADVFLVQAAVDQEQCRQPHVVVVKDHVCSAPTFKTANRIFRFFTLWNLFQCDSF